MKPVKLIMSAFGSYGGVETIEFDRMQNGLFLIAGDTGSGKTTIFDAVMFALYDTMSGKERKSVMMRSEYASEDTETYVEFTFSYGSGDIYTVKRYPAQERRSRRRNKDGRYSIIRQQGKVELYLPDGRLFNGKIAQVNKKIEEITGLTAEQFSKTMLIAQGEFQELIMDRTGKRKEIFQQIFSTQVYGAIEENILKRFKAEAAQMKYNTARLEELVKGIDFPGDSPYLNEWQAASERKDTEPDGLTDVFGKEIGRLLSLYSDKESIYLQKEKDYNALKIKITQGIEKNKLIDKLLSLEEIKKELDSLKEETDRKTGILALAKKAEKVLITEENYNKRKKEYDRALKKEKDLRLKEKDLIQQYSVVCERFNKAYEEYKNLMPENITKRDNLKQAVLKYKTVADKEEILAGLNSSIKKAVACRDREVQKLGKIKEDISVCEDLIKSYENLELLMEQAKLAKKRCDEEEGILRKLIKKKEECASRKKELSALEKKLVAYIKKWEDSRRVHEEYNRIYIACQSAFLAGELAPGSPCPVCGSLEHPHMAEMPGDAVTEDMLKKAASTESKCGAQKDKIQEEAREAQGIFSAEMAVLNEYISQLSDGAAIGGVEEFIKEKEVSISAEKNKISGKIKELEDKVTERENKKAGLSGLARKQEKAESSIGNREKEIHSLEINAEGLKKEIETLRASLTYTTREEAEEKLEECEEILQRLESGYKNADREFKDIQKKINSVKGAIEESERQVREFSGSLGRLSEEFGNSVRENGFNSVSEYKEALMDELTMKEMERSISGYREKCLKNDAGIKTISEQLDNTEKVELASMAKKQQELETSLSYIKKELDDYNFYIQSSKRNLERLKHLMEERKDIAGKLRVIKALNETANGKVHFQTYIQRQYFKQIIQAANKRLERMASGGFLLKCRDLGSGGQGETGLELDVYSPLTGKSRGAHTLSGGETFMASLSMALGMADIVQNTVGKTRLDTMFIDEGFGSLSDDVRDKAVDVLLGLAGNNRLVGVISHVSGLKEQIPVKLVVAKGKNGSSVKWEY